MINQKINNVHRRLDQIKNFVSLKYWIVYFLVGTTRYARVTISFYKNLLV